MTIINMVLYIFDDVTSFKLTNYIIEANRIIVSFIKQFIPTSVKGVDMTNWIIVFTAVVLKAVINYQIENINFNIEIVGSELAVVSSRRDKMSSRSSRLSFFSTMMSRIKKIFFYKKSELRKLQRTLAKTKQKLDKLGKELAFLSVDVVNSTEMKKNEESSTVEYYFSEYNKYVEEKLSNNNYIKSTWTPDGVMCCFSEFASAFQTAKEIITGLRAFNNKTSLFKHDFVIRCGINSGFIYFDELLPMEELTDRAIDVAAHVQKEAEANTIYVTKRSIDPVAFMDEFEPAIEMVDGYEICLWRKDKL